MLGPPFVCSCQAMPPPISVAPRPLSTDLLAAGRDSGQDLLAPWRPEGGETFLLSRAAWGLAAIARGLQVSLGRPPVLWFPGYFCNASLGPVRTTDAVLRFYSVTVDAAPDWTACQAMTAQGRPDAFVLVHVFGRPAEIAPAEAFAAASGALLVEDAAHALRPSGAIGARGGAVLYSPYKLLPLPHGGILAVRPGPLREALCATCRALPSAFPSATPWLVRRLAEKVLPEPLLRRLAARRGQRDFDADPPPAEVQAAAAPAPLARTLLARSLDGLDGIAAARRRNARFLAEFPWPLGCVPLAGGDWVPYRFVLRCPSHAAAQDVFRRLRDCGIPAESWPDLPPEVTADERTHAAAVALRRTLVLLPVHQDLDPEILGAALRVL